MPRPIQPSDRSCSTALLCRWDGPWRLDRRWLSDERWRVCSLLRWLTDSCDYAQGGFRIHRFQPNCRRGPPPKPAGALDELASYRGLGSTLIANISDALHSHSVSPPGFHIYFYAELIAGQNRAPKAGTLDAGKHHQFLITILYFSQQQRATGLCDGFNDQHAGHDWQIGKMSGKKGLVDSYVFDCHNALFGL